jgi:hypothetical protein
MTEGDNADPGPLWCRLETEGSRIRRVNVMHASGEILLSWPPERFDPAMLARMRAGQIRARFVDEPGGRSIALIDGAGRTFHTQPLG